MSVTTRPEDPAVEKAAAREQAIREAIEALRLHHNRMTQKQAGEGMGKTGPWFQERESGRTGITALDLLDFADFFGVPTDEFRKGGDAVAYITTHHPDSPAARLAANLRSGSFVQEPLFQEPVAA